MYMVGELIYSVINCLTVCPCQSSFPMLSFMTRGLVFQCAFLFRCVPAPRHHIACWCFRRWLIQPAWLQWSVPYCECCWATEAKTLLIIVFSSLKPGSCLNFVHSVTCGVWVEPEQGFQMSWDFVIAGNSLWKMTAEQNPVAQYSSPFLNSNICFLKPI